MGGAASERGTDTCTDRWTDRKEWKEIQMEREREKEAQGVV